MVALSGTDAELVGFMVVLLAVVCFLLLAFAGIFEWVERRHARRRPS